MSERRKHSRSALPPGSLLSFSPVTMPQGSTQNLEGEGVILDLSPGGCRVSSDQAVMIGHPYSLIIQLPYYPAPVQVESAIARWISNQSFGVMFIAMHQEQERHLCEFLEYLRSDAA
ncbi:hypothetical protein W02_28300 [Nitrospira sp. KM1]|uniref:PilZ domain-containing protein n=1 Tax=Nitrospira sp. KM1 TaxID=1936990 RepID=UPI0013A7A244|nr:PilZ domain-containing protein [Nitrospira sp. KM1]BCA55690.1 hypothetical protein W02_28300 [Nitrospira sp. KM1]